MGFGVEYPSQGYGMKSEYEECDYYGTGGSSMQMMPKPQVYPAAQDPTMHHHESSYQHHGPKMRHPESSYPHHGPKMHHHESSYPHHDPIMHHHTPAYHGPEMHHGQYDSYGYPSGMPKTEYGSSYNRMRCPSPMPVSEVTYPPGSYGNGYAGGYNYGSNYKMTPPGYGVQCVNKGVDDDE